MKEYTFLAKVVGGGKITIPLEVRNALGIIDGKRIEATVRLIEEGLEMVEMISHARNAV